MDSQNSNSKKMDYIMALVYTFNFQNLRINFILPNFSRTNFLSRMLQVLLNHNWVDYYEPTYRFINSFCICLSWSICVQWIIIVDSIHIIISYNHKSLTMLYKENQNKH